LHRRVENGFIESVAFVALIGFIAFEESAQCAQGERKKQNTGGSGFSKEQRAKRIEQGAKSSEKSNAYAL
jgi:hypothetical protein